MAFIRITAAQAASIRGNYGPNHALEPVPLGESSDYILTDAVLTHPAFAGVLGTLQALPTYAAWSGDGVAYSANIITERNDKLWICKSPHTSQPGWQPGVAHSLWWIAHRDGIVVEWTQPTGSHDTFPLDMLVTHNGRTWKSLVNDNTYEPGVVGTWRDQSTPPLWVAPAGSIGLWQVDATAEHNGQVWRNTVPNNAFAPGVHGWELVE